MNFKESKAIYLQIADYMMEKILQENYKEGERLPSVRECASELEVNANTCMRAYEWLCQQDIIFTKRGLGYFVSEGAKSNIHEKQRQEFFNEALPELATKMKMLGISVEELIEKLT